MPIHHKHTPSPFDLSPDHRKRIHLRLAMVQAYRARREQGLVKADEASIKADMPNICRDAERYLRAEMPNPDAALKERLAKEGKVRAPKSGRAIEIPQTVHPRTLRAWDALVNAGGKIALVDQIGRAHV